MGTTNFSGVPNLAGGAGNDSFAIGAGVALGSIDGGGGVNSLSASANGAENLTLANALLTRNVTGNVTLANIASASLNGSAANNTIDASAWTGGRTVAVNVSAGTDSIIGNGVGTTLVAANAGSTITVNNPDAGSTGTTTFSRVGNLAGGAGVDTFTVTGAGSLSGNITGAGGNDTLDLSGKAGAITINQAGSITGSGVAGTITASAPSSAAAPAPPSSATTSRRPIRSPARTPSRWAA